MFLRMPHFVAAVKWDDLIESMQAGFDGTGHAVHLAIGVGVLSLFLVNVWLGRWVTRKPIAKGRK